VTQRKSNVDSAFTATKLYYKINSTPQNGLKQLKT
jgi:hypothetical protein